MTNEIKKTTFKIVLILLAISISAIYIYFANNDYQFMHQKQSITNDDEVAECCKNDCLECQKVANYTLANDDKLPFDNKNTIDTFRQVGNGKIVIEQSSQRVLYGENINAKLYPASTTKILTALVVLNELPLKTKIKIDSRAVGIEGSSIYLKNGEEMTIEDLLFGMMLRSGNDSATALALAVSPTIESFAEKMNKMAKEFGANNSNFVNPSGLHDDNHYTTAYDLALITSKAFENDDFKRIVNTKSIKIGEGDSTRYIKNKNKMLNLFGGANGVKTGYTTMSGRCLVSSATRDNMTLISVVLNCPDMWNDSIKLLDYGFDNFEMVDIERAITNFSAEKTVNVKINIDRQGRISPRYYPLKKDNSERVVFA